jgi:hypothetical protein
MCHTNSLCVTRTHELYVSHELDEKKREPACLLCKGFSMEDFNKLDNIQDGFIHYQLIRCCQATRLQYINGQVTLATKTC